MGSCGAFKADLIKRSKKAGDSEVLLDVSNDIYFENDNEVSDTFKVTQKFIDSLKPGDELVLTADGHEESCGYGEGDSDDDDDYDEDYDEDDNDDY